MSLKTVSAIVKAYMGTAHAARDRAGVARARAALGELAALVNAARALVSSDTADQDAVTRRYDEAMTLLEQIVREAGDAPETVR